MKKYCLLQNSETNEYYSYYRGVDFWTKDIDEATQILDKDNIDSYFDSTTKEFLSGKKIKLVDFIEF